MLKKSIRAIINFCGYSLTESSILKSYKKIYNKYKNFTMIPEYTYYENLFLVDKNIKSLKGDIVECGVWRGGMIAGIAELLGTERTYYLFDSFEGLPAVQEIDGVAAKNYQEDKESAGYYDNCKAEIEFAESAMRKTRTDYKIIKGWFKDSFQNFSPPDIAILRLDGDWYESTMDCLVKLYPYVVNEGVIIIDDYYTWDGCSRAVHDYLSSIKSLSRVYKSNNGVCYIIKKEI